MHAHFLGKQRALGGKIPARPSKPMPFRRTLPAARLCGSPRSRVQPKNATSL